MNGLLLAFILAMAFLVVAVVAASVLAVLLRDARSTIVRERQQHLTEIERLNATHIALTDRILNAQTYGTPTPKEAVVVDREPDAESRVLRRISQESIAAGAQALKQMYEDQGVLVSLEEVEAEATSMLMGISPSINPRIGLLVKDGP